MYRCFSEAGYFRAALDRLNSEHTSNYPYVCMGYTLNTH